MADSSFRSYRRDVPARDNEPAQRDGLSDPLAELARLIGQRNEQGGGQAPESYQDEPAPASEFDWAWSTKTRGTATTGRNNPQLGLSTRITKTSVLPPGKACRRR